MCDGRRGHLEPVFVRQPQGRAPVLGGQGDGAVGVAHRLGAVGGAGAEHEDGVIALVPRKHRVARRFSPGRRQTRPSGASRSSTAAAPSWSTSRATAAPSATAQPGPVRPSAVSHLAGLPGRVQKHRGGAQPAGGLHDHHELGPVRRHHCQRPPVRRPGRTRRPATALAARSSSARSSDRRPQDGDLIGKAERGRLEPRCMRPVVTETIFSELRFGVNTIEG